MKAADGYRDDRPLDAKEGPYRIVLPAEKKHARWVRQVTTIAVETAAEETLQTN